MFVARTSVKTRRPDLFRLKVEAKIEFYYKQQTKKIKNPDQPQSLFIYFDILFTLTTHYDDGDYIRPFEFMTYAIIPLFLYQGAVKGNLIQICLFVIFNR